MFTLLITLPSYTIGVVAQGNVTAHDFKTALEPALEKVLAEWKGINLLFVMETELKKVTLGGWLQDIKINTRYFLKWNKLAVVVHNGLPEKITVAFDLIAPGEARTFPAAQVGEAKEWVSQP